VGILFFLASIPSNQVHDFGACLLSYKTAAGRECLFVSRDAKLDGSKAIRGGIPLVFPQFGQPDTRMPQHGFLRVNFWKADESTAFDSADGAGITYKLDLHDARTARGGLWDESTEFDCSCSYHVKIDANKLTATLEIKNTGDKGFSFQNLLHTYYMVDGKAALDGSQCYVKGLEGYSVVDKISDAEYTCGSDPVVVEGETDRVYTPPAGKDVVDVTVGVGGGKSLKMTAAGKVNGSGWPVSCVVWNPNKDKAASMGDFGDDQYHEMICVEPGILSEPTLEAGKSAELIQTIEIM
jgi:glucose-6-phosphate 1-epimerase